MHKFYFAKNLTINYLHSLTNLTQAGLSLTQLVELGDLCSVKIIFYKMRKEEFINYKINNPIIAVVENKKINSKHFIIIYKKTNSHIYYSDSTTGKNHKQLLNDDFYKTLSYVFGITNKENNNFKHKNIQSTIFHFFKDKNKSLYLLFLINISIIFLTIVASLFSKILVNYLFPNKILSDIFIITLFFITVNLLKSLIDFCQNTILQKMLFDFTSNLNEEVLLNIDKKPNKFFQHFNESSIIQKTQLIHQVSSFIVVKITKLFYNSFILISILIFLSFLYLQLALFLVILVFLFVFINYYFNTINKPKIKQQLKLQHQELRYRLLLISQREHLKTGSKANFLKYKWKQSFYKLQNNQFNLFNNFNNQHLFNSALRTIVNFSLIVLIILLAITSNKNLSFVIMMMAILNLVWSPILGISYFISDFSKDKNNFYKLAKIINYKNEVITNKGFELNKIKNVKINNLNFEYSNKVIFNNINLVIDHNTIIRGPNGSGKSTLLKLLSTCEINQNILYNDLKVTAINLEKLRKKIILYSDHDIFIEEFINDLNIEEQNKFWFAIFNKYHFWLIFKKINLDINILTIENYHFLSLGQKQLLNFLVLFKQKYLLILTDELLSNVTFKVTKLLFLILSIYQQQSLIISVSHQLNCFPKNYHILEMGDL